MKEDDCKAHTLLISDGGNSQKRQEETRGYLGLGLGPRGAFSGARGDEQVLKLDCEDGRTALGFGRKLLSSLKKMGRS